MAASRLKTVLVVDDDALVLTLSKRILEHGGYRVVTAMDGVEALDILAASTEPIELLLTDITMPRLDGLRLVERLKELRVNIPVLFMSGYKSSSDAVVRVASNLSLKGRVLQKPFKPSDLLNRVQQFFPA